MTRTSLSAADSGKRGEFYPAPPAAPHQPASSHRSPVLGQRADASSIGILSDQRESKGLLLIANLELESRLTHTKLTPLKIPNRKFAQVFDCISNLDFGLLVTSHSSLATARLIYGSAIKSPRKPFENSNLRISNRRQTGG